MFDFDVITGPGPAQIKEPPKQAEKPKQPAPARPDAAKPLSRTAGEGGAPGPARGDG